MLTAASGGLLLLLLVVIALLWTSHGRTRSAQDTQGQEEAPALQLRADEPAAPGRRQPLADVENEPTSGAAENDAVVVLLRKRTRKPPPPARWRVNPPGNDLPIDALSDADGRFTLPPGSWRIHALESPWVVDELVRLAPDEVRILWVSERIDFEVEVLNDRGLPISGALVRWAPPLVDPIFDADSDWWLLDFGSAASTDSEGWARLVDLVGPGGHLSVVKEGYQPSRSAIGDPQGRTLRQVLLPCAEPPAVLRVVKEETGDPIDGALVETPYGPVGRTSSSGELVLHGWAAAGDRLRISADSFVPLICNQTQHQWPDVARMPPAVELRLRLQRADGEAVRDALLWPTFEGEQRPERWFLHTPASLRVNGTSRLDLDVPAGEEIRFVGLSSSGDSVDAIVSVGDGSTDATLVFGRAPALAIDLATADSGAPDAWAEVNYLGRDQVRLRSIEHLVTVPLPDRVRDIFIQGLYHTGAQLTPWPRAGVEAGGRVTLPLQRAVDVTLRVVDQAGTPVPGMLLRFTGDADAQVYRRYPEYLGAIPTDHPGWVRRPEPNFIGFTDEQGRCVARGLPDGGAYSVRADLPEALTRLDGVLSAFDPPPFRFRVADGAEHVWSIPVPRLLRLQVLRAYDRLPVRPVQVRTLGGGGGATLELQGPGQEMWIPDDASELEVSSSGFHPTRIELGPVEEAVVDREVLLWPQAAGTLVLEGATAGLEGKTLRIRASRSTTATSGSRETVWTGIVHCEDPARIPLYVPADGPVEITVDPVVDGTVRWTFLPGGGEWTPGGELRLRVERESDGPF